MWTQHCVYCNKILYIPMKINARHDIVEVKQCNKYGKYIYAHKNCFDKAVKDSHKNKEELI